MKILYKDSFIAAVEKSPNMPSQPDKTGDMDVLTLLKKQTGYAAIINRLDRGVGGVVIFGLSKQAAKYLSGQLGLVKRYTAVVCGRPEKDAAELTDYLARNERANMSKVVSPNAKAAAYASLSYRKTGETQTDKFGVLSLLEIELKTGRHHQIRVQLSNAGIPVWGDIKYNIRFSKGGGFYKAALDEDLAITPALWSKSITLNHPETGEAIVFESHPSIYPFSLFGLI